LQEERAYWLVWSQLSGIGPVLLKRVQQHFGKLEIAWTASSNSFREIEGFGNKLIDSIDREKNKLDPEQFFQEYKQKNPYFWTPADKDYPRLLLEIPSPPPILHYLGQLEAEENLGTKAIVGIVGTRYPTEYGKRWTRKISAALAKHGFTVISGMAAGIDTEAHQGCLDAGGRTIGVLGTGVDLIYPASNRRLYQQIQERGLLLSEYAAETQPDRGNFPARNRIIAGLSRAILVMEAPQKSGALITSRFANEFGRDVYVLPGSLDNQQSLGCLELLDRGAHLILGEEQLLERLGTIPKLDANVTETKTIPPNLAPELAQVFDRISSESTSFDAIVQETELTADRVSASLLQLELMDLVSQLPGMRYRKK
jgi:DNA processing protein